MYALIAIGYTLVYGILFMINFAHGEVMMLGAFGGYFVFEIMNGINSADCRQPEPHRVERLPYPGRYSGICSRHGGCIGLRLFS